MHYMNIAPGILKKFGLMTVKLIGTLWNVKKKRFWPLYGFNVSEPTSHFSTLGLHFELPYSVHRGAYNFKITVL